MSMKKEAIVQTSVLVSTIVATGVLVSFVLDSLTIEQVKLCGVIGLLGILIYTVYGVVLSRLEYEETVKNLSKTLDKVSG